MLFLAFGLVLKPPVLGLADLWYPGGSFAETCRGVPHVALWGVLQKLAGPLVFRVLRGLLIVSRERCDGTVGGQFAGV